MRKYEAGGRRSLFSWAALTANPTNEHFETNVTRIARPGWEALSGQSFPFSICVMRTARGR